MYLKKVFRSETSSQKYNEFIEKYYRKTWTSDRISFLLWCPVTVFTDGIVPSDPVQNVHIVHTGRKELLYCPPPMKPITLYNQVKNQGGKSLILQYTEVCMHISWFIHISHTTVRALRPKTLLNGLSSKASEKITHRLSRAVGLLKATTLHHVPQALSWALTQPFPVKLATAEAPASVPPRYFKLSGFALVQLGVFSVCSTGKCQISLRCSLSQAVSSDFLRGFILQNVKPGKVFSRAAFSSSLVMWWNSKSSSILLIPWQTVWKQRPRGNAGLESVSCWPCAPDHVQPDQEADTRSVSPRAPKLNMLLCCS